MDVNIPEVVAEVTERFNAYEQALIAGEAARLDADFWSSHLTVRYGVNECLYGADAIAEWRKTAPVIPPTRRLGPTVVVTFGRDLACVSTEFRNDDAPIVGRQSQTWVRLDEGWRIVAAHVSVLRTGT